MNLLRLLTRRTSAPSKVSLLGGKPSSDPSPRYPERSTPGAPSAREFDWGKRSEGSAFRWVPHTSSAWVGQHKPNPARVILSQAWILTLFLASSLPAQSTRADAEKDPVLAAMLTELDRS